MLVDFSVQNFTSFNQMQEFSMVASTSTKERVELDNTYEINQFGIKEILKSAAIFGANGSGKSNVVMAIGALKSLLVRSLDTNSDETTSNIIPFLLKKDFFDFPSEFEVSFLAEGNLYRYGISIENDSIDEEWLYWTKSSRETLLFHRKKQTLEFNNRSFSEAKIFTRKEGDEIVIEKTKTSVPFVSVLAKFDGEKSNIVFNWFKKVNTISGLREFGFRDFTTNLFEKDESFRAWALDILKSFQIDSINIVEFDKEFPINKKNKSIKNEELLDVVSKLEGFLEKNKIKEKRIEVVKKGGNGEMYSIPLSMESEGTQKLIYLLGPIYDVMANDKILIIDEFDNKFHTLLCKFIIDLYNKKSFGSSQIILTCHDTNLLTKELFRRDQIWFVEKNERHESELYSLVEYKEHYARKGNSYSKDYLQGKYGAIPLFKDISELGEKLNG
ncbi:AAA family ATPase [Marinomonas pollencensis]|uniref:ATPase AAA-type core domain-containing protein n=1 Tax=Marinomonas pollencensis TaxID=491954 RepID=A0A3E0D9W0_9GAMM|nr:ATP-binding protein [Marinomonas pollencensis]REG79367.1 hypothetical protein DFP81_12028 [Marinomonas pollencensis]